MKVSLIDVEEDLKQLCEDNELIQEVIETYFKEFENKNEKILDLKEEKD